MLPLDKTRSLEGHLRVSSSETVTTENLRIIEGD